MTKQTIEVNLRLQKGDFERAAASLAASAKKVANQLVQSLQPAERQMKQTGQEALALAERVKTLKTAADQPAGAALSTAMAGVMSAVSAAKLAVGGLVEKIWGNVGAVQSAGQATGEYTKATQKASSGAKRLKKQLAGFDSLDVLLGPASGGGGGGVKLPQLELEEPETPFWIKMLERIKDVLAGIVEYIKKYFAPTLHAWGQAFAVLAAKARETMDIVASALKGLWEGTLAPLARYLLTDFVPTIVDAFSETFAPIFRDVLCVVLEEFGRDVEFVCMLVERAVQDILMPVLEFIKRVALDIFEGVQKAWDEYGQAILDAFMRFKEGVRGVILALYENILLPILTGIGAAVQRLWEEHLKPLWDNLLLFVGALVECVLEFWNNVLQPLVMWLVETFGPVISSVVSGVADVFGRVIGAMVDLVSGFLTALRGLLEFLTGVFTGDWERAWEGIGLFAQGIWQGLGDFIKGMVNAIIGLINGMMAGVTAGINAVIGALNAISVTVPDWVPGFGGKSFGFNLASISAPQIPYLAQGAVIPPNREFLAVLGDQTNGNNIEAPEALLRKIMREEATGGDVTIRFTGSLAQLARVLKPELERENKRTGGALVQGTTL